MPNLVLYADRERQRERERERERERSVFTTLLFSLNSLRLSLFYSFLPSLTESLGNNILLSPDFTYLKGVKSAFHEFCKLWHFTLFSVQKACFSFF